MESRLLVLPRFDVEIRNAGWQRDTSLMSRGNDVLFFGMFFALSLSLSLSLSLLTLH